MPYSPFLPYTLENLPQRLQHPKNSPRTRLAQALHAYLKRLQAPQATLDQTALLGHPHSQVVVTGQQAGLLGGPAYTFYKAHSARQLAHQHHQADRPAVAVFWIASQDHDTEEVCRTTLLDLNEQWHTLELALPPQHPAGRIPMAPYLGQITDLLKAVGGNSSVTNRLQEALGGARYYSDALARLLLEFMPGLVVFDPMAPELAPLFTEGIEQEIAQPLASAEAINRTAQKMRQAGLEVALRRAPGATNLFLEGADGQRRLLRYRQGQFDDGINPYSAAALTAILHHQPARLTPAAGLRPILQDRVLPTAGFVVGPGELKYVAELGEVYALHQLEPPAVIRRMGVTVLEPPVRRLLGQYGLDPQQFQQNPQEQFAAALLQHHETAAALRKDLAQIETQFATAAQRIPQLDPNLLRSLQRGRRRVTHELERLSHKLAQAELRREGLIRRQYQRLEAHLVPQGQPQERFFPFVMYLLKHGPSLLGLLETLPATGHHLLEL
jgi:bacillithiol biosynthesis cysteine-adding enzyme BshC